MSGADLARDSFGVFGTTAVLLVTDAAALPGARAILDAELAAVDLACSRFRPDSEISGVNRSSGGLAPVSELCCELISAALRAAEITGGDVDPTCGRALVAAGYDRDFDLIRTRTVRGPARRQDTGPASLPVPGWRNVHLDPARRLVRLDGGAQLDLGATAKAWAADRCAGLIADRLGCGVLVSLGGDLTVAGPPPPDGWQIRVTDDHAAGADAPGQTVAISSGGLATSSTTVRAWTDGGRPMHHIIDPATGQPATSCWRTVSVTAGTCTDANIASTASIIRSEAAPAWLTEAHLPARLIRHDSTVVTTAGWPQPQPQPDQRQR